MERFNKNGEMIDYRYVCLEHARDLVKHERGWTSGTSHMQSDRRLVIASKPCKTCGDIHFPLCRGARRLTELGD